MSHVKNPLLILTHALLRPETVTPAARALGSCTGQAKVEGLVELLHTPPSARVAITALAALEDCADPLVLAALNRCLESSYVPVRQLALLQLQRRQATCVDDALVRLLRTEGSWLVRRAALRFLAERPEPVRWQVLLAADDPHWRVRHALVKVLLAWQESGVSQEEIVCRLSAPGDQVRVEGVRLYLNWRWSGQEPAQCPEPALDPAQQSPLWDWDVLVLARNLRRLGESGRRAALDLLPHFLKHPEERVRTPALQTLREWGAPPHLADVVALLDEPRYDIVEDVRGLLKKLDLDRLEAVARYLLELPTASEGQQGWARAQLQHCEAAARGERRRSPPPPLLPVRGEPQAQTLSPDPFTRAASLTQERAAQLMADPDLETSWHVLRAAARLAKTPFWKIEPEIPWHPPIEVRETPLLLHVQPACSPPTRFLGPDRIPVAPLGVSGHYGLPVEGFVRAAEAGVNLYFWEPNYQSLTDFSCRLSASQRRELHFICGTFEADGERVRRDAERALRALRLERLSFFLLFWVQSWDRITPDVQATLEQLQAEGKIATFGLSTHNRPLAVEALHQGWNPVMVRHNAAHRGAEEQMFPTAAAHGAGLITFNITCYGRLLQPAGNSSPPRGADCYRYTLAQPGVSACLTAPATLELLEENLEALRSPELDPERRTHLLEHGARVYREETVFRKLIRRL